MADIYYVVARKDSIGRSLLDNPVFYSESEAVSDLESYDDSSDLRVFKITVEEMH